LSTGRFYENGLGSKRSGHGRDGASPQARDHIHRGARWVGGRIPCPGNAPVCLNDIDPPLRFHDCRLDFGTPVAMPTRSRANIHIDAILVWSSE